MKLGKFKAKLREFSKKKFNEVGEISSEAGVNTRRSWGKSK